MTLPHPLDGVRRWSAFLAANDYAPSTIRQYRRTFVNFIADTLLEPDEVTEKDVVEYLGSLPRKGHMRTMVLRSLKSYYGFSANGDSPTKRLKMRRPKYGPAPYRTREEVIRLLVAASVRAERRGWTILLLYSTGARRESLCAVRPEDMTERTITFQTAKGDRPYAVPLARDARIAASELKLLALENGWDTLIGVGPGRLWQWVHQASLDSGVKVWPHLLRHSFASEVYRATKDPLVTSRLLGHVDTAQIPRYVHDTETREREAVEQVFGD